MSVRATSDNFLPYARGESHYHPRPILRTPRRRSQRRLVSDFLPRKIYPSKRQLAFTGSIACAWLIPAFESQLAPRLLRRRFMYTAAIVIVVLGASACLMKLDSQPPVKQPKVIHGVVAAKPPSYLSEQTQASVGLPVRLKIPKINVDAALDRVDITSQGELGVPADPANAAWYHQGPRPGEEGSAVIDGHFGYRNHIPAVFDDLHALQKGDKLYVEDEKGATTVFVVRELRTYGSDEHAPAVFRSDDSKAHLNLITCEGTWNKTKKSFSNRLVVFADKTT